MNRKKAAILLAAIIGGSILASSAGANGPRHFHGHGHGHFRSSVGIFVGVPGPFFYPPPYYYYPRYYYPPAVVAEPVAPPVYIERPYAGAAPPADSSGYWYYCRESGAYYPYVQQCATPWERVVPNSAPPA